MREIHIYQHRTIDCQENIAFRTEDGTTVFEGSAPIETCLNCNHTELPIETRETMNPSQIEIRKSTHTAMGLCGFSRDQI